MLLWSARSLANITGSLALGALAAAAGFWEFPFPRGCLLILFFYAALSFVVSKMVSFGARSNLDMMTKQPEKISELRASFGGLCAMLLMCLSFWLDYRALYPIAALTSCVDKYSPAEICNIKTREATKGQQQKIDEALRIVAWKAPHETRN